MICRTRASELFVRLPPRGASFSMPAMPPREKRLRHRQTVLVPQRSSRAISLLSNPDAASSTILDRKTNRAGVERPRARRSSRTRSPSDSMIAGASLIYRAYREAGNGNIFRVAIFESRDSAFISVLP